MTTLLGKSILFSQCDMSLSIYSYAQNSALAMYMPVIVQLARNCAISMYL